MEWISVKDDLPKKRTRVLVSDGQLVTQAIINHRGDWANWYTIDNEYFNDVTHWMPLPEPPKV